jgi:plasmid stabilization system protein ParE
MARDQVSLSSRARADLADIRAYLEQEASARIAERQLRRITGKLKNLATFPGLGRVRSDWPFAPLSFAVPPWVVVYEPLPEGGIAVWRILHGSRDLPPLVKKPG